MDCYYILNFHYVIYIYNASKKFVKGIEEQFVNCALNTRYSSSYLLKVHQCRFENLPIYSNSYKKNTLKISHSFIVFVLKGRLIFNIFELGFFFLRIKNPKFSGSYFYMRLKIQGDFQTCIFVSKLQLHFEIPILTASSPLLCFYNANNLL